MPAKKKRRSGRRRANSHAPRIRYALNPGVGSLMLVNPSRMRPSEGDMKKPKLKPKSRRQRRPGPVARRPAAAAPPSVNVTVKNDAAKPAPAARAAPTQWKQARRASGGKRRWLHRDEQRKYLELLNRPNHWKGKNGHRGKKSVERARNSLRYNAAYGPPETRAYLKSHFPTVNPSIGDRARAAAHSAGEPLKAAGLGLASFLVSRVAANISGKIPGVNRLGPHAPVLASAALAGATYFLTKNMKSENRTPLLYGAGFALLDTILKNYVPAYMPSAAGVVGAAPDYDLPRLQGYREPMGYLPAYDPMVGVGDCHPSHAGMGFDVHEAQAGLGFDVHEAMADAGDGMGFDVREAQAGFDGYVPTHADQMNGYFPTGTGDDQMSGMGAYVPAMSGVSQERMKDAAAMMFLGPGFLAHKKAHDAWMARRRHMMQQRSLQMQPMGVMRQMGPDGTPFYVNVYCPPPYGRTFEGAAVRMRPTPNGNTMPLRPPPNGSVMPMTEPVHVLPQVPVQAPPSVATTQVVKPSGMSGAGGIFAND